MRLQNKLSNPVIAVEFRLRMRSKKTPWIIGLYLLAISTIVFSYIYLETGSVGYFNSNRSRELFILLSFIQFIMLSFVTPGLTAGVISGEREKQTLNLLLVTTLSPTKIIIGKWLSSLSFMLLLIIATMPLYSIVFLYGGISPLQLIEVFGFYIISMFAIGSLGILFSTLIKKTSIATILTYATITAYTVITFFSPIMIKKYYYDLNSGSEVKWVEWIYYINPITGLINIFENNKIESSFISPYLIYLSFFALVTILFLAMAIYLITPGRKRLSSRN